MRHSRAENGNLDRIAWRRTVKDHVGLEPGDERLAKLEMITRFNLTARYPDAQQEIYR